MADNDDKRRKNLSRRELFTFWRRPLEELAEVAKPQAPASPPVAVSPRLPPLRPPGMMHEIMLQNACVRCGKCVEVCPAEAIFPLGDGWGSAAGTPAIEARSRACVLCTGLQCSHVCPSGALIPVFAVSEVTMGSAVVDHGRCTPWATGEACDRCVTTCPVPGALIVDEGYRPQVVRDACVGCGLCEQVCPTTGSAAIRVIPRD